ncbi:MAG: pyrroline-5-carboxylate reductase [Ilumatobacteraceae bacterium]
MGHDTTVAVIGGGNMGAALVGGLLRGGVAPSDVIIVETLTSRRGELTAQFPGVQVVAEVPRVGAVIVAVKPADVHAACVAAKAAGATRLLSIAAGVTIASLEASSGSAMRVVRAMPNTPAVVGLAATALATSARADAAVRDWARQILESIGIVVELDEAMLDAFTGLVGSGPAYLFYVAEALTDAAHAAGFDADTSAKLIAQLFAGSSALLAREPHAAKELRARVTSPNGTTAAGVAVLDRERVRDAIVAAVLAARKRSTELGAS